MRQRYFISKEGVSDDLVIKEYAVISEVPRLKNGIQPIEDSYTLLCQQNYEGDIIKASISKGKNDLIKTMRTTNLFPTGPLIEEIALSVVDLYRSSEDRSAELNFNDTDQFGPN